MLSLGWAALTRVAVVSKCTTRPGEEDNEPSLRITRRADGTRSLQNKTRGVDPVGQAYPSQRESDRGRLHVGGGEEKIGWGAAGMGAAGTSKMLGASGKRQSPAAERGRANQTTDGHLPRSPEGHRQDQGRQEPADGPVLAIGAHRRCEAGR